MRVNQAVLYVRPSQAQVLDRAMRDPRLTYEHRMVLLALTELADPKTGEIVCTDEQVADKVAELESRYRLNG